MNNKRLIRRLLLGVVALTSALLLLIFFPEKATLSLESGFGASPAIPSPNKTLFPTVRPAKAVGWTDGQMPIVAEGLKIGVFADGLDHPRWLYQLPNGDLLVAETNAPARDDSSRGLKDRITAFVMDYAGALTTSADRISLLRDADGDGIAELKFAFLEGLHSPFGMTLVGDDLYVANADAVVRFPYSPDDVQIPESGEEIIHLPSGRNHHWTKNVIASMDGSKLYITVGSNSNVGEFGPKAEVNRAAILEYDLDTGTLAPFATGLRNPNGLAWEPSTGSLWTAVNERDEIGSDLVPDYITSVGRGEYFGWPHFYYMNHCDSRVDIDEWPAPYSPVKMPDYAVGAHTAALGIAFSNQSSLPAEWRNGMFVALHGSWNRRPRSGYKVIYIPFHNGRPTGMPTDVVYGFLDDNDRALGRPVGVVIDSSGSLLIADDVGNVVWRVTAAVR